jgi:hypothetical protein
MASSTSILNHIANFPTQALALPPTPAVATFRTLKVLELMGFNFLNGGPPAQSIANTYTLLQFQCQAPTDPNSTIFVIFSVRTCTAPHTRTYKILGPGGLVAHGFPLLNRRPPAQTIKGTYALLQFQC